MDFQNINNVSELIKKSNLGASPELVEQAISIYEQNKGEGYAIALYKAIGFLKDAANISPVDAKSIIDNAMQGNSEYEQYKNVASENMDMYKEGIE